MTSEGLGEMFEGDSADTCAGKFPLVSMGGWAEGLAFQTRERGPPSALAEFTLYSASTKWVRANSSQCDTIMHIRYYIIMSVCYYNVSMILLCQYDTICDIQYFKHHFDTIGLTSELVFSKYCDCVIVLWLSDSIKLTLVDPCWNKDIRHLKRCRYLDKCCKVIIF